MYYLGILIVLIVGIMLSTIVVSAHTVSEVFIKMKKTKSNKMLYNSNCNSSNANYCFLLLSRISPRAKYPTNAYLK